MTKYLSNKCICTENIDNLLQMQNNWVGYVSTNHTMGYCNGECQDSHQCHTCLGSNHDKQRIWVVLNKQHAVCFSPVVVYIYSITKSRSLDAYSSVLVALQVLYIQMVVDCCTALNMYPKYCLVSPSLTRQTV